MHRDALIEAAIQEVVRRLVAEYQPEKIMLFGSYAYGEPHADSDLDMLIVKEMPDRWIDRLSAVRRIAYGAHHRIPFGPLVMTPREIEDRLNRGDPFMREMLERGEVLYDDGRVTVPA